MGRIVCKFGGSSLADPGQFKKVRAIVESDPRRQIIVVSAPGKRNAKDAKVTDLLFLCHQSASVNADFSDVFARVRARYLDIESSLGLDADMSTHLDRVEADLRAGVSRDHIASRGEYLSGLLNAAHLNAEFIDPIDCLQISDRGDVDGACYAQLAAKLEDGKRYVIPGFYGRDGSGQTRVFSRGGSDISGAIAARAVGAECYENWTDVSGLLMADPRIVENPRRISEVTYDEIRELAYMGASVLHDDAIAPVREAGIPIEIRNTNAPDDGCTRISTHLSHGTLKTAQIAAIAGKRSFMMISLSKALMNKEIGFARRLFAILEDHGISFEHCPSSIDSMSVILESGAIDGKLDAVLNDIRQVLHPDHLDVVPQFALIAVVGEEMAHTVGIAAKVFEALRDAGVNVRVMNQGASELNIIVGVAPDDYEPAVRALYAAFIART